MASYAKEEGARDVRDARLDELRAIRSDHPEDEAVLWCLGHALLAAATDHEGQGDHAGRDALRKEIDDLVRKHPPTSGA